MKICTLLGKVSNSITVMFQIFCPSHVCEWAPQYNRVQFNNTANYKLHNTHVVKRIPHTVNQN